jgi:hypothetical protein
LFFVKEPRIINALRNRGMLEQSSIPLFLCLKMDEKRDKHWLISLRSCNRPLEFSILAGTLKVGQFYAFFRVRKTPTIAPIKTMGANLTNSHSNAWKATPITAVSGAL